MSIFGQINENTERWSLIKNQLDSDEIMNVVEIGTWKGMGSTLCIVKNKRQHSNFISLESNLEHHEIAKQNLLDYSNDVKLIYGRIVEIDDVKSFVENLNLSEEQKVWLANDLKDFENAPNVYNILPERIDFLLLDGGEFSTYNEWTKLKNLTSIVALDDTRALKCSKIVDELLNDTSYELVSSTNEGNGFSIFKKK
jgi:hypothetical protein